MEKDDKKPGQERGYPEDQAEKIWTKGGITFSIIRHEIGHFCGYARLPKRPVKEQGYDGILIYAPIHGGITYAIEDKDGSMIYGFDCAHAGDQQRPELKTEAWLVGECQMIAYAVIMAARFEDKYLLASTDNEKGNIIDDYHKALKEDHGMEFNIQDNFGAMIGVLFGKL